MSAIRGGDSRRGRVCIVGPTHLANTPRIVKEADALHDAGFDVRVVFSQGEGAAKRTHDRELLRTRSWRATVVRWSRDESAFRWWITGVRQHVSQRLSDRWWARTRVAERGEGRVFPELAAAASSEYADLYIGHYAEGLSAAAVASQRWNAQCGFDAEDFHTGEGNPEPQTARVDFIQRRYLPSCVHLTAASTGIAERLAGDYALTLPVTIHNTFPWAEREALDGCIKDRRGPELSLYWYSQTVGTDRGIQDAIRAAGLLGGPVQIHLRGNVSRAVREELLALGQACGVAERLHFHSQVPPTELLSRASEHDVGLALEQGGTLNRAICATNKMFFYLLAGVAIVGSDVPGQRAVLAEIDPGALLYPPGDYHALASRLEQWRTDPDALRRAKAAALHAARTRWNWELESAKLVAAVTRVLLPLPAQSRASVMEPV